MTSAQIIGVKGCEDLPRHGLVYVKWQGAIQKVQIPMTDYKQINELIGYWQSDRCFA